MYKGCSVCASLHHHQHLEFYIFFIHSDKCIMRFHCVFICIPLTLIVMLNIFHPLFSIWIFFLVKYLSFSYFLIRLVLLFSVESWKFFIYLNLNPLSDTWFKNIFSPSVVCCFILLPRSLTEKKKGFQIWCSPVDECFLLRILLWVQV